MLFTKDASLLRAPYTLKSIVSLADFRDFVTALADRPHRITSTYFAGLLRLCEEFGSESLSARLSDFQPLGDRGMRLRSVAGGGGDCSRSSD
jgi:hypothetical protein